MNVNFNLKAEQDIDVVRGAVITADFLPALCVQPALGRNLLPEEDRPGGNTRVVLVTHGFLRSLARFRSPERTWRP